MAYPYASAKNFRPFSGKKRLQLDAYFTQFILKKQHPVYSGDSTHYKKMLIWRIHVNP